MAFFLSSSRISAMGSGSVELSNELSIEKERKKNRRRSELSFERSQTTQNNCNCNMIVVKSCFLLSTRQPLQQTSSNENLYFTFYNVSIVFSLFLSTSNSNQKLFSLSHCLVFMTHNEVKSPCHLSFISLLYLRMGGERDAAAASREIKSEFHEKFSLKEGKSDDERSRLADQEMPPCWWVWYWLSELNGSTVLRSWAFDERDHHTLDLAQLDDDNRQRVADASFTFHLDDPHRSFAAAATIFPSKSHWHFSHAHSADILCSSPVNVMSSSVIEVKKRKRETESLRLFWLIIVWLQRESCSERAKNSHSNEISQRDMFHPMQRRRVGAMRIIITLPLLIKYCVIGSHLFEWIFLGCRAASLYAFLYRPAHCLRRIR